MNSYQYCFIVTAWPGGALCTVDELRKLHENCLVLAVEAVHLLVGMGHVCWSAYLPSGKQTKSY
jgi:hypothetical protein